MREKQRNKAGYTAQDAPSMCLKIMRDGRTYGRTDGHTLLQRCDGASKIYGEKIKNILRSFEPENGQILKNTQAEIQIS